MKAKKRLVSKGFYKDLLNNCPDGAVIADVNGIISFASKRIYNIHDIPSDIELKGRSVFELIADNYRDSAREDVNAIINEKRPGSGKYKFLKYDGSSFYAEVSASPILDEKNEVSGFFSITRDISEQVRTNGELLMKENMLDSAINGMAIAKFDGELTYVNKSAVKMWGYESADEIIGKAAGSFWCDFDEIKKIYELLLIEESMVVEIKGKKKDGSVFDVQTAVSIIKDEKGMPAHILGSFLDITERKMSEEKILNSLMEKEILFKEIHHRVKNNLQIVSSLINLQLQNVPDKQSANVLIDCQNRILSMAKLHESLYQSENLMFINIPDYIRNIVMHLLISYDAMNKIKIKVDIDNIRLGMDTAIPCGLIINEILSNSIKHGFDLSAKSEKLIDLSMKYDEYNAITLRISDNGFGIPKEHVEKNHSLGMKLIFALIDQINGKVSINSDEGTEFVISFDGKEIQ